MLNNEISRIVAELTDVSDTVERLKLVADQKDKDLRDCENEIKDVQHLLEFGTASGNLDYAGVAARLGKLYESRRTLKNEKEKLYPLLMFYAAHGETMADLLSVLETLANRTEVETAPVYTARSDRGENLGERNDGFVWKPARPVLVETPRGIKAKLDSVGGAARIFNVTRQDIFNCCYGERDSILGFEFTFVEMADTYVPEFRGDVRRAIMEEWEAAHQPDPEPRREEPTPRKRPVATAKRVRFIDAHGQVYEYDSATEAENERGISQGYVSRLINKRNGEGLGGLWEYITD